MDCRPAPAPPGPTGLAAVAAYAAMRRSRIGFCQRMRQRYGAVSRLSLAGRSLAIIGSPEAARDVLLLRSADYERGPGVADALEFFGEGLLTSSGEAWARQRRAVATELANLDADGVVRTICAAVDGLAEARRRLPPAPCDMTAAIVEIVGRVMEGHVFGAAVDLPAVRAELRSIERRAMTRSVALVPGGLGEPPGFAAALASLRWRAAKLLRGYRDEPAGDRTLFDRLARAAPAAWPSDMEDQVRTFLLASQDNVVAALSWTVALLAARADLRTRIRGEVRAQGGLSRLRARDLPKLRWTRAALMEAMRLYPPVWAITRRTTVATRVGGFTLGPGTDVVICPWLIHRDPANWPRAEEYAPERFLDRSDIFGGGDAFLPFGWGPRRCVAIAFAGIEATTIVAALVDALEFERGSSRPPAPFAGFSLHPDAPVVCQVRPVGPQLVAVT